MNVPGRVKDKVKAVTRAQGLGDLPRRVDSLEVAVAENAELAVSLTNVLDDLERAVAGVIEGEAHESVGR